jgi:hypothetical protein
MGRFPYSPERQRGDGVRGDAQGYMMIEAVDIVMLEEGLGGLEGELVQLEPA